MYVFFFFKQKTAYEIGTGDWSSDVCSSDLALAIVVGALKTDPRENKHGAVPGTSGPSTFG